MRSLIHFVGLWSLAHAACPYMGSSPDLKERTDNPVRRSEVEVRGQTDFLEQFTLDDTNSYLTSDVGGPIQDDASLKAGERGPTLLEDFVFRQKIQHFDHERVCWIYHLR